MDEIIKKIWFNIKNSFLEEFFAKDIKRIDKIEFIVTEFLRIEEHITAEEFYNKLCEKQVDCKLTIKEIKIILDILCRLGIAQSKKFENNEEIKYEHLHYNHHHDHMICIKCNKVIEFFQDNLEKLQNDITNKYNFTPLYHNLELYGLCSECYTPEKQLIPLVEIPADTNVNIVGFAGSFKFKHRLVELGLKENVEIKVIKTIPYGPVIIQHSGHKLILGYGEAKKIMVYKN